MKLFFKIICILALIINANSCFASSYNVGVCSCASESDSGETQYYSKKMPCTTDKSCFDINWRGKATGHCVHNEESSDVVWGACLI